MNSEIELMYPALFVESMEEEFDLSLPPSTGNEYLRRVRLEASKCPDIVVADIDASKFTVRQTLKYRDEKGCQPAPKGYAPSLAWQKQQVSDFSAVRMALSAYKARCERDGTKTKTPVKLPRIEDDVGWCRLCFGSKFQRQLAQQNRAARTGIVEDDAALDADATKNDGILPLVSIVSNMSQPLIEQVLDYHLCWFEATGFTQDQGRWFYALLTCLEKPLKPDTCSSLRSLVRLCANLRATLEQTDARLSHLNLMICLVTRYFDQSDLADNDP